MFNCKWHLVYPPFSMLSLLSGNVLDDFISVLLCL
jgi:hypothetical protein